MGEIQNSPGGIYVHVPFCVRKCDYCDFYSCTHLEKIPAYLCALKDEMRMVGEADGPTAADTLYLGGGTPSLLSPGQIHDVIDSVYLHFPLSADAEISMEVNPGTVDAQKMAAFQQAGVNRVSIGTQSFSDISLDFLTRIHTADHALQAVAFARSAGFDNIGLDLIYGLPGQSKKMWQWDLQTALQLHPAHLSCYMLSYEPGTSMEKGLQNKRFSPLPDKDVAQFYAFTVFYLETNGFYQYEVSNFSASPQTRSRHNQKYWSHTPYIGLGPSAHSLIGNHRFSNVCSVDAYIAEIGQGRRPIAMPEKLSLRQLMMETLYLRLRCTDGISIPDFEKRFQLDFNRRFAPILAKFASEKYLEMDARRCRLTQKGMRFADGIASYMIDAV